jgi:hypothetical protein
MQAIESGLEQQLQQLEPIVALTNDGQVTLLKNVGNTEDFIITCLVAENLGHRLGKAQKQTMSVDDLIAAGGLAQRIARQTIYNSTSSLSKSRIIQKKGNEFFVDERTVMQFFATKLPELINRG